MNKKNKIANSEFESHPAHFLKSDNGLSIRPFRFSENYSDQNSDQTLPKLKKYKDPVLYKGKRWWIEYQFRIPEELRHLYRGAKWKGFPVFEDINRIKTDDYAEFLLAAVKYGLENGYDPFEHHKAVANQAKEGIMPKKKDWTITQGLSFFLQKWKKRGNDPDTDKAYERIVKAFQIWLTALKLQNSPLEDLSTEMVEAFLEHASKKWSNRTYNNNLNFLRTAFTFLGKKGLLPIHPGADVHVKKTKAEKHRYYDTEKFKLIRKIMHERDRIVEFAAELIYYLCIRSNQELRAFRIEDIYLDRRQVLIKAEHAKTDADRYVPIPDDLYPKLARLKETYPGNYYVIGGGPAGNRKLYDNEPRPIPFGKNFLGERFSMIRELAGLDDRFTLYSMKHTRIVHLKQDGARDGDIMQLTGHKSFAAYAGYLRDLGIDGDAEAINKKTRKF